MTQHDGAFWPRQLQAASSLEQRLDARHEFSIFVWERHWQCMRLSYPRTNLIPVRSTCGRVLLTATRQQQGRQAAECHRHELPADHRGHPNTVAARMAAHCLRRRTDCRRSLIEVSIRGVPQNGGRRQRSLVMDSPFRRAREQPLAHGFRVTHSQAESRQEGRRVRRDAQDWSARKRPSDHAASSGRQNDAEQQDTRRNALRRIVGILVT